jgi:hypothetical protein
MGSGPIPATEKRALQADQACRPSAMTNFAHWRIRVLLYAGRPDWFKLATVTP